MKDKLILKGHVLYAEKTMYKWVADFGENTCKTCAAMDGKMFEKDKIPYWPHPNCRCRVEEVSVIDVLESEMHDYKEELDQLSLQANELLGDSHVLEERVNKLEKEFDDEEVKKLSNDLNHQQCEIYRLIDYIEALNIDTVSATIVENVEKFIEEIKNNLKRIYKEIEPILIKYAPKPVFDKAVQVYGKYKEQSDGAAFWEIASSKFSSKIAKKYIKKNGYIVKKVSDLHNKKLELFIRAKLLKQIKTTEARGVVYYYDSSISKAIVNDAGFRKFVSTKKEELLKNRQIDNKKFNFEKGNLKSAYHYVDIINIRLNSDDTLYALVIDTYDFNKYEKDPLVRKGGEYQDKGKIEPYYNIAILKIPKEIWKNF